MSTEHFSRQKKGAKAQKAMDLQDVLDSKMPAVPREEIDFPPLPEPDTDEEAFYSSVESIEGDALIPFLGGSRVTEFFPVTPPIIKKTLLSPPSIKASHKMAKDSKGFFKSKKMSKIAMKNKGSKGKKKKNYNRSGNVGAAPIGVRKYNRKPFLSPTVADSVRGLLYPHAISNPRLLDGATHESQTHTQAIIDELTVGSSAIGYIYLTPGVTSCLYVAGQINANPASFLEPDFDALLGIDSTDCTGTGIMKKIGAVDRWRHVSTGLKCNLLNTSEQNDGWFESFRVTDLPGISDVAFKETVAGSDRAFFFPKGSFFDNMYNSKENSKVRNSYICDSLKNIDKYYFRLNPFAEEHPFIDVNKEYEIQSTNQYVDITSEQWFPNGNDTQSWRPLVDHLFDHTFDSIIIFIHPGANGSKILMDAVKNLEVVYSNESQLARFHQATVSHKTAAKAVTQTQHNQASAGISLAST